ncbi:MAG: 1,4-alpha-glucan branching enzyme, partial [Thermoleophilaceae bacterium]|nr:1,4-alpha-glucan branching enzyme [Thermoleophilaceae bacterium]
MSDLDQLVDGRHADPHSILGAHPQNGGVVVRTFRPSAERVVVRPEKGKPVDAEQVHPGGVFEAKVPKASLPLRYELEVAYPDGNTFTLRDPYAFLPTLGELDMHLAAEGRHEDLYDKLGAHVQEIDGVVGTSFAVWAPAARSVSVVGDFNSWDGRLHPMRALGGTGIWELFVPGTREGATYKYEIHTPEGETRLKADPLAQAAEHPPQTSSIVHRSTYEWNDDAWMQRRAQGTALDKPMSIYEVHMGSWRLNP